MKSAFGVEHDGISKSFVNGKFVRATDLTPKQAAKVRTGGQYKKVRRVKPSDKAFLKERIKEDHVGTIREAVATKKTGQDFGVGAAAFRIGGKSSGESVIIPPNKNIPKKTRRTVLNHEATHAAPKRSSYRLHHQIARSPKKLMREEARADYRSAGHYTKHPDVSSTYAQMARAQRAVERKGPDKPFKLDRKTRKAQKQAMKDYPGLKIPTPTNREALSTGQANIQQAMPHYDLSGNRGDKAVRSYRQVHDRMRNAGAKHKKYGQK